MSENPQVPPEQGLAARAGQAQRTGPSLAASY